MKHFFLWCSGANMSVLEECPTDETKYAGIGATIFLTSVLAGLSGGYALFTVFKTLAAAIPFAFLWAFLIFNLDRVIVSGMRKQKSFLLDLTYAVPRLLVAVLLAVVISRPLELKLFEREIRAKIAVTNSDAALRARTAADAEFSELKTLEDQNEALRRSTAAKQKEVANVRREVWEEVNGTGGTRRPGRGDVYEDKKQGLDAAVLELETLEANNNRIMASNDIEIARLRGEKRERVASSNQTQQKADGFLTQIYALDGLTASSPAMALASFFITLLFISIETAPVMVKLLSTLSPYRPYDEKLEDREFQIVKASEGLRQVLRHKLEAAAQKEISDFNDELNTEMRLSVEKNKLRLDAELQANQDLIQSIAKAQAEIAGRIVVEWKKQELENVERDLRKYVR